MKKLVKRTQQPQERNKKKKKKKKRGNKKHLRDVIASHAIVVDGFHHLCGYIVSFKWRK
jgi:hypothetical protein